MRPPRRLGGFPNAILLFLLIIAINAVRSCEERKPAQSRVSTPVKNPVTDLLRPVASVQRREGIAAAILIDTSGSMQDRVRDTDGVQRQKIDIAQRAAMNLVKQFDAFAKEHTDKVIYLGIYEFSQRFTGSSTRTVVKLGPPNPAAAGPAIARMVANGDTPIGDAMIVAKRDLDATGLSKRHILVITDGENNKGYSPQNVTQVISSQAAEDRASVYFVAFDIAATKFDSVRDSGGLVLAASNETDLQGTLDYLLSGKILAEQPPAR
jgi:Mg-chelatase subunit ChlD